MTKDMFIFAGVNGAGKSTLYETGIQQYTDLYHTLRINADEIAKKNNWDWKASGTALKSMKVAVKLINTCITNGTSFNIETTLAGRVETFEKLLKKARQNGFRLHLLYVGLDSPDLAVQRVNLRVNKGGHGVDESTIRKRYPQSLKNLKRLIYYFDSVDLYDNTITYKSICHYKNNKIIYENYSHTWAEPVLKALIAKSSRK